VRESISTGVGVTGDAPWLQVLQNSDDGGHTGSLIWFLSQTLTPGGSRLLRRWVSHPLTDLSAIQQRLDAVGELRDAVGGDHRSQLLSNLPTVLKVWRHTMLLRFWGKGCF
jgi:DNA mismatch repair ATPase MutS